MKEKYKRNQIFVGTVGDALDNYINNDAHKLADEFWHSDAIATAVTNANNAKKSLAVLCKHMPTQFHSLIRFAQPKTTWYLNVENGVTATQLNMLLDELLLKIAKDIGYAPRIQVAVQPSAQRWAKSGFPLTYPKKIQKRRLNESEPQAIINDFLKN